MCTTDPDARERQEKLRIWLRTLKGPARAKKPMTLQDVTRNAEYLAQCAHLRDFQCAHINNLQMQNAYSQIPLGQNWP